jgi:hypothetical protein
VSQSAAAILATSLLLASPAIACLHIGDAEAPVEDDAALESRRRSLETSIASGVATPGETVDLALLLLGRARPDDVRRAIDLLLEVEKGPDPGHRTAAALGSAYERSGDDARAELWLRTAIGRAPDATRARRERLHLAVIERRRAEQKDAGLTSRLNFLNLDLGAEAEPHSASGMPAPAAELYVDLARLAIEEPGHADVFFVLGDVAQLAGAPPAAARAAYLRAIELGHPRRPLLAQRIGRLVALDREERLRRWAPAIAAVLFALLAVAGALLWQRWRDLARAG